MSSRFYVATRKGLFTFDRREGTRGLGGTAWQISRVAFLADPVYIVTPDARNGKVYAALGLGHFGVKLHRSHNEGGDWEECAVPVYPAPPEGAAPERNAFSGKVTEWRLELIWSLEPGGADEPGALWCGTAPGGLFRSDDFGTSWTMMRSLWDDPRRKEWFGGGLDYPAIHSICVDPRDSKHVTVGVSCGGVWVTRDRGESWKCQADGMRAEYMPPDRQGDPHIQDPHRVVACPASPDHLWAQHHNGVFRSTDGSHSWHEVPSVKPSVFGFAVAVHPHDPGTAWLVPAVKDERRVPVDAKVVVARTRDAGKSFEELRNGLPQEHAYDITFRHALDIDETGNRLVFGSTTGSLWITEDQGDHWQCLSTHLPPVYCVRFVA